MGQCGRQNILRSYLKIWDWDLIFGRVSVVRGHNTSVVSDFIHFHLLPISYQNLLNFQAVARHSCMELLNVYEEDLKSTCINNEDLVMKSKIRRLDEINKLLAHRPWAIKGNHIKVHILQVINFQKVFLFSPFYQILPKYLKGNSTLLCRKYLKW